MTGRSVKDDTKVSFKGHLLRKFGQMRVSILPPGARPQMGFARRAQTVPDAVSCPRTPEERAGLGRGSADRYAREVAPELGIMPASNAFPVLSEVIGRAVEMGCAWRWSGEGEETNT